MYEVEVKVRADHAAVETALDEAGATRVDAVVQEDTYYDAPHRDFAETDEALRIRREWKPGEADDGDAVSDGQSGSPTETRITYKGPLLEAESKSREEHETAVADADAAVGVFDGLGFEPAATVRKERAHYRLDGYTVTLDSVDGLGEFVEVETETDDDGIEAARDGALAVLDSLGLDPDAQIRTSYLGLLLESDAQQ
ncbi:class IV adenylate cyclase [Halosimplex aquaticum]|uniref:Class IV adenylate cyclase n=1 Tax=Halosimplex aquaticum TaxID=3026162 RepID=A0ABD5Y6V8_9EURY|nr:class IV adenylate cyclase [Halosimplex aquaticum]